MQSRRRECDVQRAGEKSLTVGGQAFQYSLEMVSGLLRWQSAAVLEVTQPVCSLALVEHVTEPRERAFVTLTLRCIPGALINEWIEVANGKTHPVEPGVIAGMGRLSRPECLLSSSTLDLLSPPVKLLWPHSGIVAQRLLLQGVADGHDERPTPTYQARFSND